MAHLSFTEHPASVGETYFEHLGHAAGFAANMLRAGLAFFINALFPFFCRHTGPDITAALYDRMVSNRQRTGDHVNIGTPEPPVDHDTLRTSSAVQGRSKAMAWWIEFENGEHSPPFPTEAEVLSVIAEVKSNGAKGLSDGQAVWIMSSEGHRVAISHDNPRAWLEPKKVTVAILLILLVAGASWGLSRTQTPPAAAVTSPPLLMSNISVSQADTALPVRGLTETTAAFVAPSSPLAKAAARSPEPRVTAKAALRLMEPDNRKRVGYSQLFNNVGRRAGHMCSIEVTGKNRLGCNTFSYTAVRVQ